MEDWKIKMLKCLFPKKFENDSNPLYNIYQGMAIKSRNIPSILYKYYKFTEYSEKIYQIALFGYHSLKNSTILTIVP